MQRFISKYALAAHLALLGASPLFVIAFAPAATARLLLWLSFFMAVWVLMEPSRHPDELLHDARVRVRKAIIADPCTWLMATVVVVTALQWINGGVASVYDAENFRWYLSKPMMELLPGSVDGCGASRFAMSLAILVSVAGCRHALGRSARIAYLFSGVVFSGLAGLVALIFYYFGGETISAEVCKNLRQTPITGIGFGFLSLGGVVAIAAMFDLKWTKWLFAGGIALGLSLSGLAFFAPVQEQMVFVIAIAFLLLVCSGQIIFTHGSLVTGKFFAPIVLAALTVAIFLLSIGPIEKISGEWLSLFGERMFPDGYLEARRALSNVAVEAWKQSPWNGSGTGSFEMDIRFLGGEGIWSMIASNQKLGYNAYLHLIAEQGILGAFFFVGLTIILIVYYVLKMVKCSFSRSFYPLALLGPLSLAAGLAIMTYDVSMLRVENLVIMMSMLALSANAFVKKRDTAEEKSGV